MKKQPKQIRLYRPKTKSGYELDEVVSALQKFIRRGMEYEAVWIAHELIESGYWKYLFRRLMIISAEDLGLASPLAHILTSTVYSSLVTESKLRGKAWFKPDQNRVDMVVMYMARAKKSRTVDYLGGTVFKNREAGEKIKLPSFVVDQHTKRGRAMGKGDYEFFCTGSMIKNKGKVDKDEEYKKKCLKLYGFKNLKRDESKF